MIDPIRAAVIAAGEELSDEHGWGIDEGDGGVGNSTFFDVVYKHVSGAVPADWRSASIAGLRAEIAALEAGGDGLACTECGRKRGHKMDCSQGR